MIILSEILTSGVGMIGIVVIALIIGIMFITYTKTHRLVIRDPLHPTSYITTVWVWEKKDKKDHTIWWVSSFFDKKLKLPEPPKECIGITNKGKKYAEVYRVGEGWDEFIYIQDAGITSESTFIIDNKKVCESFKPFTKVQRQTIIGQYATAELMRNHNWLKENAINVICVGALAICLIMFIVYSGEFFQSATNSVNSASGLTDKVTGMFKAFGGIQDIMPTQGGGVVVQQTEAPPQK